MPPPALPPPHQTRPTLFLCHRSTQREFVRRLQMQLREHGLCTWRDVEDLGPDHANRAISALLAEEVGRGGLTGAVIWVSQDLLSSPFIKDIELPALLKRAASDERFILVVVAGPDLVSKAQREGADAGRRAGELLATVHPHGLGRNAFPVAEVTDATLAGVARPALERHVRGVHQRAPADQPMRIALYTRLPPGPAITADLVLDWSHYFLGPDRRSREAPSAAWHGRLLPALATVSTALEREARGRELIAFGKPALPAATALGAACMETRGQQLSWLQDRQGGQVSTLWSLRAGPEPAGFDAELQDADPNGTDIAVLVSVTHDAFAALQATLEDPSTPTTLNLRGVVHLRHKTRIPPAAYRSDAAPEWLTPGHAAFLAQQVRGAVNEARRAWPKAGLVHLYLAGPAGLAMMVGQLSNTFRLLPWEFLPDLNVYRPTVPLDLFMR